MGRNAKTSRYHIVAVGAFSQAFWCGELHSGGEREHGTRSVCRPLSHNASEPSCTTPQCGKRTKFRMLLARRSRAERLDRVPYLLGRDRVCRRIQSSERVSEGVSF